MAINLVVAVTDHDWFTTLSQMPNLSEVNFWAPSTNNFRALKPGELFLFKLRSPHNVIVGGGIFAHSNIMPCSLAWEAFGEANGARSEREMRTNIARLRSAGPKDLSNFKIGCRVLTQPFFLEQTNWIPQPKDWSPNIVAYKRYSTEGGEGLALWEQLHERLSRRPKVGIAESGPRYGSPYLIKPRLGQGGFRVLVTDAYHRRCAVTQERTLPALDAAHIRPYHTGGDHVLSNGLLLRRDIHGLFDTGYVTVTPSLEFEVSQTIREEFENGRDYYKLQGKQIQVPNRLELRPDHNALSWHNDNIYKG